LIPETLIKKGVHQLITKQIIISKWKFNLFGVILLSFGAVIGSYLTISKILLPLVYASDTTSNWDFSVAGDYTLSDSAAVEISGSSARLKVQNYSSDANTALLLHLDEASGDPTDSSSNANTATESNVTYTSGNFNNAADFNGSTSQISVADSASLSLSGANTIETWMKLDNSFAAGTNNKNMGIVDKGEYRLFLDHRTGKVTYELADGTVTNNWDQVAGNDINGSWDLNGKLAVNTSITVGNYMYVGLGNQTGDAEVWRFDDQDNSWTKVGGDGINSSWSDALYEEVLSFAADGTTYIYASIGNTAGDAEIWRYTIGSNTWTKYGGDGVNSSWLAAGNYEGAYALQFISPYLYAGLGASAGEGEVWSVDTSAETPDWTQIGGDNLNSSWPQSNGAIEIVYSMTNDGTNLYVGLGNTSSATANQDDAEVWRWNGSTWTKIAGDAAGGWVDADNIESVLSMTYFGSALYVGTASTAGDADVWRYESGSWTKIGGDATGWAASTYEGVYSLTNDGTNLYAGLGATAGDNEIWRYVSGSWTKLAGDDGTNNFTNTHLRVDTLRMYNGNLYAGITASAATGQMWKYSGSGVVWSLVGGNFVNSSWGVYNLQSVESFTASGNYLYAGTGLTVAGNAQVWRFDGTTWTIIGGQGINSSWTANTYEQITSMIAFNGDVYVGLGTTDNDAEVWKWNGTVWAKVAGDNVNSAWGSVSSAHNWIYSFAIYNGQLHAGLGGAANTEAEVWRMANDTGTWTKVGGDNTNSGWNTGYESVHSMAVYGSYLYAGLGTGAGDAEVWRFNGTTWGGAAIGGDGLNSSWTTVGAYETVEALRVYNGKLYAGLGTSSDDAEVWEYNGTTWSKIGGDDLGWASGEMERVRSFAVYDGDLYASLGTAQGDAEVWRYRDGSWTKIGGDGNGSWTASQYENATSLITFSGKLYAGLGDTANLDASVWSYGNNAVLKSNTSSFDTDWHHIAATYDGSTMKIYVDGVEDGSLTVSRTLPDTSHPVLIGNTYGSFDNGIEQGYFEGLLDEIRISSIARISFNSTAYTASAQTVQPTAAVMTSGIRVFDDFTVSETLNGGSLNYRLSTDGGTTWKYYSGDVWTTSASTAQVNDASTIDTNIGTLTAGSGGILWQAVLDGDGTQQVTLNTVSIGGISDSTGPTAPDTLTALSASAGSSITTDTWYTHTAPYFSWTGATDAGGSGVWGYYVYFGTDNTADPQTAGSFQTTSNYTASGLSSGSTYYLRIKSRDNAQNVSSIWEAFTYKFDSTAPTNPSSVSISPAGYSATNDFTFSWPAGSDAASGIAGYQYKTATPSGDLSDWSVTSSSTSINIPDAAYQADANTFYLRTVDNAGNISSETSATYYYGGEGPSEPRFLAISPSTSTTNSFAVSWQVPLTYSGSSSEITYCYTVNTLPSADSCTFTSQGATSLSASSFATQVGLNTFYVVAKNPATSGGSINYGSYASATFTANTSAPGIPLTLEVGDISIKSSETWRLVLSWNAPTDTGSGVSSYKVYSSTDDSTYTLLSSVSGLSYVATDLDQQEYFYKVKACDSVGNCGAFTAAVSDTPTGKYTDAAGLSSGPSVSGVTTKKAKISWGTDREADSKIAYGTTSGTYFDSEPSSSTQTTDHAITLTNLSPGTTYYYKAKWTDEDGNTGISSEKTFSTDPAPTVTDPKAKNAGLSTANIEFTVTGASKVKIYYGKTSAFGSLKEISTSTSETTYTATLEELEDGTKYFYKINTFDSETSEYEGSTLSFETLPRPKITGVRIQQVIGTAQPTVLVTWTTNTETSSIITYYPENDLGAARDEVNIALTKDKHRVLIRGLLPQTNYVLLAKGRDQTGNEAKSEPQKFTTSTDTRPPQISGLKVEGTNIQKSDSSEQTSQIVVSWDTDEAATSQIEFGEGTGTSYSQKTQEDANMTFNHLVVISNLTPSKVYHLRVISKDKGGNIGNSVDTVTITPKPSDNAFDLVLTNLREVFGFLGSANQ
jgi:hypothetical protein